MKNKLNQVTDGVSATDNEVDLVPRGSGNYTYYTDGSVKSDANESISLIIYDTFLKQPKEVQLTDGRMRCANLAARFIVKDLLKFFETKDDLLTLSLGSRSDFFSRQI
jgi:hypothetical protein